MEYRFILEIPHFKVLPHIGPLPIVRLNHLDIIIGDRVMNRQVSVIVLCVELGLNIVNKRRLALDANHVLDGLSLVILLASRLEEVVRTGKPSEHFDITISSAHEEHVLSEVVPHDDGVLLFALKELNNCQVLPLACAVERRPTVEIGKHAELWIDAMNDRGRFHVLLQTCNMQS